MIGKKSNPSKRREIFLTLTYKKNLVRIFRMFTISPVALVFVFTLPPARTWARVSIITTTAVVVDTQYPKALNNSMYEQHSNSSF